MLIGFRSSNTQKFLLLTNITHFRQLLHTLMFVTSSYLNLPLSGRTDKLSSITNAPKRTNYPYTTHYLLPTSKSKYIQSRLDHSFETRGPDLSLLTSTHTATLDSLHETSGGI